MFRSNYRGPTAAFEPCLSLSRFRVTMGTFQLINAFAATSLTESPTEKHRLGGFDARLGTGVRLASTLNPIVFYAPDRTNYVSAVIMMQI